MQSRIIRLVFSLLFLAALLNATGADDDDSGGNRKRRMPRVRLGGIMVNTGYTHWSGGGWGGPWGWGGFGPYFGSSWLYGYPFWGGSFFYPGFINGYAWGPDRGEVKLTAADRASEVYIEGAFAGTAAKLKTMWLDPGVYNIELRSPDSDKAFFQKKIYVLSGKTLRLEAK